MRIEDATTGRLITNDARLRNINKGGFGFVTEEHLNRGGKYRFKMELVSSPLEVDARIVHFHIEATYYVCGAKMEGLSLLQRSRINRFLASKSPRLQRRFMVSSFVGGGLVAFAAKILVGLSVSASVGVFFGAALILYLLLPF